MKSSTKKLLKSPNNRKKELIAKKGQKRLREEEIGDEEFILRKSLNSKARNKKIKTKK